MKVYRVKVYRVLVYSLFIVIGYCFYKTNQPICKSCETTKMYIVDYCMPVRSSYVTYNKLNCFCDQSRDWKEMSLLMKQLKFNNKIGIFRDADNFFGIKVISCSDDELQYEVFDDSNVFLYVNIDTAKNVSNGALKELFIKDIIYGKRKIGLLDIGATNRKISLAPNNITLKYFMDYDELNSEALISFQQAIHFDSTYQKKFSKAEYQLFRKRDKKHEATIRYEDSGARFYFDVF